VRPTSWRDLLVVVAIGAALGFAVMRILGATDGAVPRPPLLALVTVVILGVAAVASSFVLRPRLQRVPGHRPIPPLVATRIVALAFATSRAGAAVAGFCLGWLLAALASSEGLQTTFAKQRALLAGLTALAGLLLLVGGLLLERACRLPPIDDEDDVGSRA